MPEPHDAVTPRDQRRRWIGRRLIQTDGVRIGTVADVYLDDPEASWALVRRRRLGGRQRVVPLDRARSTNGGISVPFTREDVHSAPAIDRGAPTAQESARLMTHYGRPAPTRVDGPPSAAAPKAPRAPAARHRAGRTIELELAAATAEATYRRERLALYRAKVYGGAPGSPTRLRDLERARDGADAHLHRVQARVAEATAPADGPGDAA